MYTYIFVGDISIFYDHVIKNPAKTKKPDNMTLSSRIFTKIWQNVFFYDTLLVSKHEVNWLVFKKVMTINIFFGISVELVGKVLFYLQFATLHQA